MIASTLLACPAGCMPAMTPMAAIEPELNLPIERVFSRARAESWFVRIAAADSTFEGRVIALGPHTVTIARQEVILSDVTRVDRRSIQGTGTVPGAIAGALALGFVGLSWAGMGDGGSGDVFALVGAGVVTGGFLGMVIGKAIRPGRTEWIWVWQGHL